MTYLLIYAWTTVTVLAQPLRGPSSQGTSDDICNPDGSDFSFLIKALSGFRSISTTGCPLHDWTSESTPNDAEVIDKIYELPLEPTLCDYPTAYVGVYEDLSQTIPVSNAIFQAIGVAYDGVAIFGNADSNSEDAYINEGSTFDECNGHPNAGGQYHYHSQVPDECLLNLPTPKAHSDLFAFMADGIPLFGPLGDDGIIPDDLDECNGHVDQSFPYYHYHITANYKYPYTVNCLRGIIDTSIWTNFGTVVDCQESDTQYNYSSLVDAWMNMNNFENTNSPTSTPASSASSIGFSLTVFISILSIISGLLLS
jgi:hypothetical protein